jgi:uncharacterized protein (TIGR02453 family)
MDFAIAFNFLKKLAKNNNREWFEKNKPQYLAIKESFESFISDLHHDVCEFDTSLGGIDPKKFVFRIYRDVRFSKDKRPYKKNISAGFSAQGRGLGVPGYYLHIEPGDNSFIGIGLYGPQGGLLIKVRQEIDYNGEELSQIFKERKFKKYFGEFWDGDSLKLMPKGYPKDHKHIKWIKLKSFIVMHSFTDEDVMGKKFSKEVVNVMKAGKPINDFLNRALD